MNNKYYNEFNLFITFEFSSLKIIGYLFSMFFNLNIFKTK